jgi:AraC-type DNA-binding domain-containing proteins
MEFKPVRLYASLSVHTLYTIYILEFSPNYRFYGERHNFWEIAYFIEGAAGVTSDDSVFDCTAGDMVIQRPEMFHSMWAVKDKSIKMFMISFNGDGLDYSMPSGKVKLDANEKLIVEKLMEEIPSVFAGFDINEYERIQDKALPGDAGYQIVKNYVELLCLSLIRRGSEARCSVSEHKKSAQFAEIVAYLKENIKNDLTLEQICRDVSESPSSLKAMFRKFTGGGIIKYYNYLRCEYCVKLLRDGHQITDIISLMNFSSQNYFSYFIKRETGAPPSSYMERADL